MPQIVILIGLLLLACVASSYAVEPLAWWRFEDVPPGQWLDAQMGSRRRPFTVTVDSSGHGHAPRTFNTRPDLYPPDTSPEFSTDVPTEKLSNRLPDRRSVRFNGHQYLYTVDDSADVPLYERPGSAFTVEGMFKLAALPNDYDGRPQVLLEKASSPVVDTLQLAVETAPPLTTRPATSRPATTRSTTAPATKPSTRPTTRPATLPVTRPAFEGPTERANDHPVQPIECYVAGTNAWPEPTSGVEVDHFAVTLVDAHKITHVLRSDQPLSAGRWYAFAVVFEGERARLYLNDLTNAGGYQPETTVVHLPGGLYPCRGTWSVGCGLIDDVRDDWYQGWIDEVRLSIGAVPAGQLLAAGSSPAPSRSVVAAGVGAPPASVVHGLADPEVLFDQGTYYLYGTRDQVGFPVYTSADLLHWERGPDVFRRQPGMWGVNRYWAPSPIKYRGKYYLFYSALGHLADSGQRMSHRVCVAVADNPIGPFEPHVAPLPLIGKAVIDPSAFVDVDGHVYLYFVADMSENEVSQIFVARLNDGLTGVVGEPVLCIQPSQTWEGKFWNEGPHVFQASGGGRRGDVYVMTYSAQFWHSPEYGVGFATSPTPTGPWTKNPANPILQQWRGLYGTGGDCVVPMHDGRGLAILFHANGPPGSHRRDTYIDRLLVTPDVRLGVMLKPQAWSP